MPAGRPRKATDAGAVTTRRRRRPHSDPLIPVQFRLAQADLDVLDVIATELASHTGSIPNRTRSLRWAIHELAARLDAAEHFRGAGPMFGPAGPMVEPPG